MDPVVGNYGKANGERTVLAMVPLKRYVTGTRQVARTVLEVNSQERNWGDQFHRAMVQLNPGDLYLRLKYFNAAPPLYQAYLPLTLLWKFATWENVDPVLITSLEEEISPVFIQKEELSWFTRFVYADRGVWLFALPRLFERAHYSHVSLKTAQVLEGMLSYDFVATPAYISFIARHIRDGSFPLSYGTGIVGLLNWLTDLQKRTTPSHFVKIMNAFPFTEHFDCCHIMLQQEPTSQNSILALACLRTVFNIYSEEHWTYLHQLGTLWASSSCSFNSLISFIAELEEQVTLDPPRKRLEHFIAELFFVSLSNGKGHYIELLHLNPVNRDQPEVRKLLCQEVQKQLSENDPIFIKNLFLKLIDYPDFPTFWAQFPLCDVSQEDLHQLFLAVEKTWPALSFTPVQQSHYDFYRAHYVAPDLLQSIRMAHFFPYHPLPTPNELDLFFTRQTKDALLALYWTTRSLDHLTQIIENRRLLLELLESKTKITPCLENWTTITCCLYILGQFPLKTSFSSEDQHNFERAFGFILQSVATWIHTSNRLPFEFFKALSYVAERYPHLFTKEFDLTLTLEASFAHATTRDLQLEVLDALGRFQKTPFVVKSSPKLQSELAGLRKEVKTAMMVLGRGSLTLENQCTSISHFLRDREEGKGFKSGMN